MKIKIGYGVSNKRFGILVLVLFALLLIPIIFQAQESQETPKLKEVLEEQDQSEAAEKQKKKILVKLGPSDKYDRGVPRNAVAGFFAATNKNDMRLAGEYLDLRNLPIGFNKSDGPELARQLKIILDRSLWVEMDLLSIEPEGHKNDGLPSYRDLVGQIQADKKKYDILLQRVPRKDGTLIWKFSSRTVRDIPAMYDAHGYGTIGEKLSQMLPSTKIFGLTVWQWIYFILIIVAATILLYPAVRVSSWFIRRKQYALSEIFSRFINGPLYVVLIVVVARSNFELIHPSLKARAFFEAGSIMIILFTWMLIRLASLFRESWALKLERKGRKHATVLLKPAFAVLNITFVLFAIIIWLDNIGFSVSAMLAGLGIGGIAIALATQKSIENFIGALTLYLASPVRVGDYCRFGDKRGTVLEIGLRATKIKTPDQTVVIIPNADFAGMQLENLTGRERYRFDPMINLRADSSPDQVRYILIEFQKLLYAHSMVADGAVRARFVGFGLHSLDIRIKCYISTNDYTEYLAVIEDLNLRIMEIIREAGTEIAIPAAIEYRDEGRKSDKAAKQKAEAAVAQWRDKGEISLELTPEKIEEIKNTIPFPA